VEGCAGEVVRAGNHGGEEPDERFDDISRRVIGANGVEEVALTLIQSCQIFAGNLIAARGEQSSSLSVHEVLLNSEEKITQLTPLMPFDELHGFPPGVGDALH